MKRLLPLLVAVFAAAALLPGPRQTHAQKPKFSITGRVVDPSGKGVGGAILTVFPAQRGKKPPPPTRPDGSFTIDEDPGRVFAIRVGHTSHSAITLRPLSGYQHKHLINVVLPVADPAAKAVTKAEVLRRVLDLQYLLALVEEQEAESMTSETLKALQEQASRELAALRRVKLDWKDGKTGSLIRANLDLLDKADAFKLKFSEK
jgi:hypothetical protein